MRGPKRNLTDEQVIKIVRLYFSGATERQLAERFNVGRVTIGRTLQRAGVAKPPHRAKPRIGVGQKRLAIEACQGGMPIEQSAARFSLSTATLNRALRDSGTVLPIGRPPSCELNHAAFDVLTPEALYWLGFLFTDGSCSIGKDGGTPVIGIIRRYWHLR